MPGLHSFICPSILPFIPLACPPSKKKRLLCIHSPSFMLLSPLGNFSSSKVGHRLPLHLIAHHFEQVYTASRFQHFGIQTRDSLKALPYLARTCCKVSQGLLSSLRDLLCGLGLTIRCVVLQQLCGVKCKRIGVYVQCGVL